MENEEIAEVVQSLVQWLAANVPGVDPTYTAFSAASIHGDLHSNPVLVQGVDGTIVPGACCNDWPCKRAAVSFALFELDRYQRGQQRPVVRVVEALGALAKELRVGLHKHHPIIAHSAESELKLVEAALTLWHPSESAGVEFRELVIKPLVLMQRLERLVNAIEESADSAEITLRNAHPHFDQQKLKGRQRDGLLISLAQHLRFEGSFTFVEIARLVPDGLGGGDEFAADRARKRVSCPEDMRMVLPSWPEAARTGMK